MRYGDGFLRERKLILYWTEASCFRIGRERMKVKRKLVEGL